MYEICEKFAASEAAFARNLARSSACAPALPWPKYVCYGAKWRRQADENGTSRAHQGASCHRNLKMAIGPKLYRRRGINISKP